MEDQIDDDASVAEPVTCEAHCHQMLRLSAGVRPTEGVPLRPLSSCEGTEAPGIMAGGLKRLGLACFKQLRGVYVKYVYTDKLTYNFIDYIAILTSINLA